MRGSLAGARRGIGLFALAALALLTGLGCSEAQHHVPVAPPAAVDVHEVGAGASCFLAGGPVTPLLPLSFERASRGPSLANLRLTVDRLADPTLEGRLSGSAAERGVAVLLARTFAGLGLAGAFGDGYCQAFLDGKRSDQNVAAVLRRPGGGAPPVLVVGAHYDGQGRCGPRREICPSADDNASGVAAVLEAARVLAARRAELPVDVVFALFGSEEQHRDGSRHFAAYPPVPRDRVQRMVNLDMVGRPLLDGEPYRFLLCARDDGFGYVVGPRDHDASVEAMEHAAYAVGVPVFGFQESLLLRAGFASDSVSFSPYVPTLFLSTSIHGDYHRPGDVAEKIDHRQIARAVELVVALALEG